MRRRRRKPIPATAVVVNLEALIGFDPAPVVVGTLPADATHLQVTEEVPVRGVWWLKAHLVTDVVAIADIPLAEVVDG